MAIDINVIFSICRVFLLFCIIILLMMIWIIKGLVRLNSWIKKDVIKISRRM